MIFLSSTLSPIKKAVAAHLATGKAPKVVADECGINVHNIYVWKSDPAFVEYLDKLADAHSLQTVQAHVKAKDSINLLLDKAVAKLGDLIDAGKSESAVEKACIDVLHMAGLKPTDKLELNKTQVDHLVMTDITGEADQQSALEDGLDEYAELDDDLDDDDIVRRAQRLINGDEGGDTSG